MKYKARNLISISSEQHLLVEFKLSILPISVPINCAYQNISIISIKKHSHNQKVIQQLHNEGVIIIIDEKLYTNIRL